MKKNNLIVSTLIAVALFVSSTVFAGTIEVTVKGMVCSFCAQGIEKNLLKNSSIEKVHVDLDKKLVHIVEKPKQSISDADVTKIITDAGYSVSSIKRSGS